MTLGGECTGPAQERTFQRRWRWTLPRTFSKNKTKQNWKGGEKEKLPQSRIGHNEFELFVEEMAPNNRTQSEGKGGAERSAGAQRAEAAQWN